MQYFLQNCCNVLVEPIKQVITHQGFSITICIFDVNPLDGYGEMELVWVMTFTMRVGKAGIRAHNSSQEGAMKLKLTPF